MGIGMKTRKDNSSEQGTLTQAPKKKNPNQTKEHVQTKNKINSQTQFQSRPQKRKTINKQQNSVNSQKPLHTASYEDAEDFTTQPTKQKKSKKPLIITVVVILIIVSFGLFWLFNQANLKNNENTGGQTNKTNIINQSEEETTETTPEEGTTEDNGFETGDSNVEGGKYEEGTLTKTTPEHYSSSDFLKDLNGYEIPAVYTVQNITYDVAHVNYQAKRATIDDGMEFYWLEINYNGKKYRSQCSYNMFRNLESEGICKVAVELLTLDSGQQVVSCMKVVSEDYTIDDAENDLNF